MSASNTKKSFQHTNFFYEIKQIVYPWIKNSTTHLTLGQTEVVIEEVTLEDQKPEYIIEVKASEAPSKSELASALASIEDPNQGNL